MLRFYRRRRPVILILIVAVLILLIFVRGVRHKFRSRLPSPTANPSTLNAQLQSLDCLANSASCPQINIIGETIPTLPYGAESPFRGAADPSIRKDPSSNRLWMSYSWPNIHFESKTNHVPGVDIHLAYSDDGGVSWHYQGPLWSSYKDTNKAGDGGVGYSSYEVSNLLPVKTASGVTWYGARAVYFLPMPGGFKARPPGSIRLQISQASSPQGLSNSSFVTLGTNGTSSQWGVDFNLATLSPELKKCGIWNEPSLYYDTGTLYLALECLTQNAAGQLTGSIVVFSTQPTGDVKDWKWQYKGQLAGEKEGAELGGQGVTQIDLAKGVDGKLLAILSPEINQTNHLGCKVIEVDSLENPKLTRDSSGKLKIRASITASDLGKAGPGACSYDPSSATGVILVRRMQSKSEFVTTLNATGIKP